MLIAGIILVLLIGVGVGAYFLWLRPKRPLPGPDSPLYQEYAEAFQLGLAGLDADRRTIAEKNLDAAVKLIPEEPAAWANRGLLHLRYNELEEATRDLEKADKLAPDNTEVEILLGLLAERKGKLDEAVKSLRKAIKQKPEDVAAVFALARLVLSAKGKDSEAEYQRLLEEILRIQPNNLVVLRDHARIAALRKDAPALQATLKRFDALAVNWQTNTRKALEKVEEAAGKPLPGDVPARLPRLDAVMKQELGYQRSADAVNDRSEQAELRPEKEEGLGEPLRQFVRLAPLRNVPAAADVDLKFTAEPIGKSDGDWSIILPVWLTSDGKPAVFMANARKVRRIDVAGFVQDFPSGKQATPPTAHGILAIDWNNDYRTDLLLAGAGGLRFFQQKEDGTFVEVTAGTGLEPSILGGDYFGAWAADYEMDGDLDIILAPRSGPPLVLRNNFDGTFTVVKPFAEVKDVRAFAWVDLDNDGAPDAAFLDAEGKLHVFSNERAGLFHRREVPKDLGKLTALAAADINGDGVFDLAALRGDGAIMRISDKDRGKSFDIAEVARWRDIPPGAETGSLVLLVADLDNNGALDLIAAGPRGSRVWLGEGPDKFSLLPATLSGRVFAAGDMTGKGRLDLLGLDDKEKPLRLVNRGSREYHWLSVRVVAEKTETIKKSGDNRINSFAIGSRAEVRIGTLVQTQMIATPRTHFGLGENKDAHVLRCVWTNGYPQNEFDDPTDEETNIPLNSDRDVLVQQRLKGSCPFLFAYDGKRIAFVNDFMWSTPLGMYIGGQDKGGFLQTQEWIKIRGDQLVPRGNHYDLRVHANLWETHFFDHLSLIVVDHPQDTEIFLDERFALTPMVPQVHVTSMPRPVARAWDHHGKDVTEIVRCVDARYLDTCGRGTYQGLTRDHWVEVDLGEDAPREGPLWLLAHGWIHPTDSSINVALSQGTHDPPSPLVLEVPDGKGGWKAGRPALGFPAGKNKTIMIRLDGIEGKGVSRRFRVRTNMEIFWDALHYASGLDAGLAHQKRLAPDVADLRYRGYLAMTQANASSPELPHYERVTRRGQRWRDLEGFYTRYGDVRELLEEADDRYAILNAGDEIALQFPVPPGPPRGWKRDFVWVSDGWVKDGDFNTAFSKTVLPLPSHDLSRYDRKPTTLEGEPVYKTFPDDWVKYHTRYVAPHVFERGLRAFRR
jgi:Tfp pilus assembly protein PilF